MGIVGCSHSSGGLVYLMSSTLMRTPGYGFLNTRFRILAPENGVKYRQT